jgi:hypothetical protein
MLPNATGGANWQGGAFDPETKMFYIFTNTQPTAARPRQARAGAIGLRLDQGAASNPNRRPARRHIDRSGRRGGGARRGGRGGARANHHRGRAPLSRRGAGRRRR